MAETLQRRSARLRHRVAAGLGVPLLVAAGAAWATAIPAQAADEVGSAKVVPMQVTGDPSERFSLVILGDGYTAAEQDKFYQQVEKHLETMWSIEPYKSYRNNVNVYAVGIVSGESGVSCDRTLDAPRRNTPLKMQFWSGCSASGVERLLVMDNTAAKTYAAKAPKVDQILALANSDTYGGAGGSYATASGGNAMSALISPHEIGHSLGGLQDEYDYYSRGVTTGDYVGTEPKSAHHTLMTAQQMKESKTKWWRWLGEPSESGGTIGTYEGGQYYSTGIWRPSRHSQMKTLGYQYDQVSREIMTERIASRVPLVPKSTATDKPVASNQVLWVETANPVYHEVDVTWARNGEKIANPGNLRTLDLAKAGAKSGDTITATIVDNTEFVRDPALRAKPSMTQVRTWTVGDGTAFGSATPQITSTTPDDRPVGAKDVVSLTTTHRDDRAFGVKWSVDGKQVANPYGKASLDLSTLNLRGSHEVTATVFDPAVTNSKTATATWQVDAAGPTVKATVSTPVSTSTNAAGEPHYVVDEQFSMKLVATDDRAGALVSEFRLDGDGWHNYYGWPTDPNAPFLFTPTGTNVDDLVYGNLGSGGMSLSPFQKRTPGYGLHRVEYRSTDAAGNIGPVKAFTVEVRGGSATDDRQVIVAPVDVAGGLALQMPAEREIVLDRVTLNGKDTEAKGALSPYGVIDARGTSNGWELTAQVSNLTSDEGTILARNLGWTPSAKVVTGDLPVSADDLSRVDPGAALKPGSGIGDPSRLCSAPKGHSAGAFTCGGGLTLGVPGTTPKGTYSGVLTLTLI